MYTKHLLALTVALATLVSAVPLGVVVAGPNVATREAPPEADSIFTDLGTVLVRNALNVDPEPVL